MSAPATLAPVRAAWARATTTPTHAAIRAVGLRKSYGKQIVLDVLDLDIPEGTVFALLGPNGAGKTTTVHILPRRSRRPMAARRGSPGTTSRASPTRFVR